ncbi:MAG: FAD:protein FMN transferase, partial [Myxococcales bacterium]|nr:FAD:protein FMN transferase [Myxococcales bacterium]
MVGGADGRGRARTEPADRQHDDHGAAVPSRRRHTGPPGTPRRVALAPRPDPELVMFTFRAMNTDVTVMLPTLEDGQDLADAVAATFAAAERRFSRVRIDSELAALHRARDPIVVSAPLFDALTRARAYVELTDGAFDPAVGSALAAHGYDRSFAPGALDRD